MASSGLVDSLLIFVTITVTILFFGGTFLFILCAPRFQFSLRFLLVAIGCIAVALGAWSAVLHSAARRTPRPDELLWDKAEPAPGPATPGPPNDPR